MSRTIEFICTEKDAGRKAEDLLREKGFSRRLIIALKKTRGALCINNVPCKTADILAPGDVLSAVITEDTPSAPSEPCGIIVKKVYEDEDLAVYDKPAGMAVHRCPGHYSGTLENVFAAEYGNIPFRAVNRLDKDTSGLCIVGKNKLGAGLSRDCMFKTYYAVCCGVLTGDMLIDAPIGREDGSVIKRTVCGSGKRAVTRVYPISTDGRYTFLRIVIETGRTHQIRVHLSYKGFPLAGDSLYGGDMRHISRQALHCGEMTFIHPVTREKKEISSGLPEDIRSISPLLF